MPLHTIRAKIDYYFTEANTVYGKIGVKVWVNHGEVISDSKNVTSTPKRQDTKQEAS